MNRAKKLIINTKQKDMNYYIAIIEYDNKFRQLLVGQHENHLMAKLDVQYKLLDTKAKIIKEGYAKLIDNDSWDKWYDSLPIETQIVVDDFADKDSYPDCRELQKHLLNIGEPCDYGLDGVPYVFEWQFEKNRAKNLTS